MPVVRTPPCPGSTMPRTIAVAPIGKSRKAASASLSRASSVQAEAGGISRERVVVGRRSLSVRQTASEVVGLPEHTAPPGLFGGYRWVAWSGKRRPCGCGMDLGLLTLSFRYLGVSRVGFGFQGVGRWILFRST
jgi:hypothetical protein